MKNKIHNVKIELCGQEIIAQVVAKDWTGVCDEIFGNIQITPIDENKINTNNKSLFCKVVDFMESEEFKHTDQTVDGQDIFKRGKDKVIIEILESEVANDEI